MQAIFYFLKIEMLHAEHVATFYFDVHVFDTNFF